MCIKNSGDIHSSTLGNKTERHEGENREKHTTSPFLSLYLEVATVHTDHVYLIEGIFWL